MTWHDLFKTGHHLFKKRKMVGSWGRDSCDRATLLGGGGLVSPGLRLYSLRGNSFQAC
jgi:hypothetical protein